MRKGSLIIFAKMPRAGRVKTRLGQSIGMNRAAEIYRELAGHAFDLAEHVASNGTQAYLFFDPDAEEAEMRTWVPSGFTFVKQQGNDLGERMRNAFSKTFQDGATRSVIIGTDVPELDVKILNMSYQLLDSHDIVVGPSTDGGYYLLGMHAPLKDIFSGVSWSTSSVFQQTVDRIDAAGLSRKTLPTISDIDTEEDYLAYLGRKHPA